MYLCCKTETRMKTFETKMVVDALPEDVYSALTNAFAIELWTGYKAVMEPVEGSEFEMWEGDICGRIVRLVENELVEQEWYFGEQEEESIVSIKIMPRGKNKATIAVTHTNIPDEAYEDITEGWTETYLAGLKQFLEEGDD